MAIVHVLLCGGFGKRLWPLSRAAYPKPFISLFGEKPLFDQSILRSFEQTQACCIVANELQQDLILGACARLPELNQRPLSLCFEPASRNTAASIALAAFQAQEDDVLWVTPADHWIAHNSVYKQELAAVLEAGLTGKMLTLGITPHHASTQYGYIQRQDGLFNKFQDRAFYEVQAFHEKPEQSLAQRYLASGDYFWNSGMFAFQAKVYLTELKRCDSELYQAVFEVAQTSTQQSSEQRRVFHYSKALMDKIPKRSVDVAVMEKSQNLLVLPSQMQWLDLGSFDQIHDLQEKDLAGNTQDPKILYENCRGNVVLPSDRVVALAGVDDLVVVDTPDALLVSKKGQAATLQTLVDTHRDQKPNLFNNPAFELRPWGQFRVLSESAGTKVKEIQVKPGCRLSLQSHQHRREHWVLVQGQALVHLDDQRVTLTLGQSLDIPVGAKHRLVNEGKEVLVIVECQFGSYLGEDDIIRHQDDYHRALLPKASSEQL